MVRCGLLLAVVLVAGCNRSARITASANAKLDAARAKVLAQYVYPECDGKHPESACGLIWGEVGTEVFRRKFTATICKEDFDAPAASDDCKRRYTDLFQARLEERYFAADQEAIGRTCRAHPEKCADPMRVELEWMLSHDTALVAYLNGQREKIQVEHDQAQAEDYRRRMDAARAVGEALKQQPETTCESTTIGGTTRTTCR